MKKEIARDKHYLGQRTQVELLVFDFHDAIFPIPLPPEFRLPHPKQMKYFAAEEWASNVASFKITRFRKQNIATLRIRG